VQGWRFIHHSYALVAQAFCVTLERRGDIELRFEDVPYHDARWQAASGILDPEDEAIVRALRAPEASFSPEATLAFRSDLSAPPCGRKFVFDTPELRVLRPALTQAVRSAAEVPESVHALTPSRWAATAFERFGMPPERVHVVPLGFDPRVFRPDEARRAAMRRELGVAGRFVFLNVGGMTRNKGIDVLLRAFARALERLPEARLVLKGVDDLYASRDMLQRMLAQLPARERERVASRLLYIGERRPAQWMADLIRAADFYVSPYLAEGFNLPVLEAAACGVPIICTGGGPTDEFTQGSFAWRIRAEPGTVRLRSGQVGECLRPDEQHLTELLLQAASDPAKAHAIGADAAANVSRDFTWERVTDRLCAVLFPDRSLRCNAGDEARP
jgi:glycosyltransferase involved in cell wall biosynthesis